LVASKRSATTKTIVGVLEEILTNTNCHAFDLAEWFGEEYVPLEIVGGNKRVLLILGCWDMLISSHCVAPVGWVKNTKNNFYYGLKPYYSI
jgi:hypothetical protein